MRLSLPFASLNPFGRFPSLLGLLPNWVLGSGVLNVRSMCLEYAWHGLIMSDRMCSKFPPGHWSQPLMDATGPLGPGLGFKVVAKNCVTNRPIHWRQCDLGKNPGI